jgi:DNA-directed RNA polymerase subunit beta'
VEKIENQFSRGLITEEERYQLVIGVWNKATEDVTKALLDNLRSF